MYSKNFEEVKTYSYFEVKAKSFFSPKIFLVACKKIDLSARESIFVDRGSKVREGTCFAVASTDSCFYPEQYSALA